MIDSTKHGFIPKLKKPWARPILKIIKSTIYQKLKILQDWI